MSDCQHSPIPTTRKWHIQQLCEALITRGDCPLSELTKATFTNALQTASGPTAQVYRDNFDVQFAKLSLNRQSHVLHWDLSAIDHNAGLDVAGMLGFDMLHSLTLHLDYRDGLVKFEPTTTEASPALAKP